jgi:hypothetical protein
MKKVRTSAALPRFSFFGMGIAPTPAPTLAQPPHLPASRQGPFCSILPEDRRGGLAKGGPMNQGITRAATFPVGACSDGIHFWIASNDANKLARY